MATTIRRRHIPALLGGLLPATAAAQGAAEPFPSRPIRLVVPYGTGGSVDPAARIIGAALAERLRQPVVVENRPGASGALGTDQVIRAPADGHTLLFQASTMLVQPILRPSTVRYDVLRDLAPVAVAMLSPMILVVTPTLPVRSVAELVEYARARPGELNAGSGGGVGSWAHLCSALFQNRTGVRFTQVFYGAQGAVSEAMLKGEVHLTFDAFSASGGLVRAGTLRGLAAARSGQRLAVLPDLPTIAEAGIPNLDMDFWQGFLAPKGTPPAIVARLNAEINAVLAMPAVRDRMGQLGFETLTGTPDAYARQIAGDIAKWAGVIQAAQIKVE